jgi:hypothetical protein
VFYGRSAAAYVTTNFDLFFFCPRYIDGRKAATAFPPIVVALRAISPNYSQLLWPTFGWLLRFPIQRKPPKLMAPSLSLF